MQELPQAYYEPPVADTPPDRPWSIVGSTVLLVIVLVAQALVGLLLAMLVRSAPNAAWIDQWITALVLLLSTGIFLTALLFTRRMWTGVKPMWNPAELRDWRAWALVLGVILVAAIANGASIWMEPEAAPPTLNEGLLASLAISDSFPWLPMAVAGLSMVVLAPLTEEWFFRGILQPALTRRWGPWVAIPVTALVFGLLHWPGWTVTGIYGLAFGWVTHRRSSLTISMVAHGAINLLVFILLLSSWRSG